MKYKIPIYKPYIGDIEKKYVLDCIKSSWISSKGSYIEKFEDKIQRYTGAKYVTSVSNGTCALHLAFLALGIGEGDEVISSNFTYVASTNAILYVKAKPIFTEIKNDLNIDETKIEEKITNKTKAIIITNVYGYMPNYDLINKIAKKHNLYIIEDAAESFGAKFKNQISGTLGDISTFSFFGNKTITTGEGGMVLCKKLKHFKKVLQLKNQGNSENRIYYHELMGYNYRMTNIQAAIGLAQLEKIDKILRIKENIFFNYRKYLNQSVKMIHPIPQTKPSYWMIALIFSEKKIKEKVDLILKNNKIETRPFFYPIDKLPFYEKSFNCKLANIYHEKGLLVPSYPGLMEKNIKSICNIINKIF